MKAISVTWLEKDEDGKFEKDGFELSHRAREIEGAELIYTKMQFQNIDC